MTKQTPGKIYLADQRGLTEAPQFRRYSTLNFGSYAHEHKGAMGNLQALNEETLAGVQRVTFQADQTAYVVILPITGALNVHDSLGGISAVDVGEVQVFTVAAGKSIEIVNLYEADLISFLHIWITAHAPSSTTPLPAFAFSSLENTLTEIVPGTATTPGESALPFSLHLGCFAGRTEAIYHLKRENSLFFTFVIAGAFEVAGRLLHEKDGLALWDIAEVELEALSNNALVVVLEINS